MDGTHHTFCRICEALCGLEVDVAAERIVAIRPDPNHVATAGFACQKGLRQHKMYASPDRLRYPERRVRTRGGDKWERASWAEALADIGARVQRIRNEDGANAIAMYVGTAAGFSVLHPVFAQGFMTGLGSRSMYSSATQDCANKFAVARELYGFPFTQPFPDVLHTDCLIVVGANPVVSKWSFLQVPNPTRHLRDIVERGGAVYVVDPRRTETAKATGEHVFIRPDTDVFFFLAFLHEVLAQGGVDQARVDAHMHGLATLRAIAQPWTPERAAEVTGVDAGGLRQMVARYLRATRTPGRGAALYSSTGVNMGSNGSLCFWLQEAINAITGNLDRRGGTLVGRGVIDFPAFGKKSGVLLRNDRSRVGDLPSVNDAFAGGLLADEILTPGPGRVKALFVTGGNPLITMPNAGRLREALGKLDLLVTLDIYKNETGALADWVLPCTSPLERADLPFIFPLMLGLQARPYLQATRALIPPDGEQRDEATIYLDLARASGVSLFGSRVAQNAIELLTDVASRLAPERPRHVPQERLLSWLLRATGQGGFERLLRERHGRLRDDHRADDFLGKRVTTDDGKIALAPAALVAQAEARLAPTFAREQAFRQSGQLKLITKRAVQTHNSWTHNIAEMVADDRDTNYLYMHPEDAAARDLRDGDFADVTTEVATVRVGVRLLDELMPGVVALPHGWGHQHAPGLSVASQTRGVNVNLLAADGAARLEKVSGMAHLTGFPVKVTRAAGPADVRSWSGIAPAAG